VDLAICSFADRVNTNRQDSKSLNQQFPPETFRKCFPQLFPAHMHPIDAAERGEFAQTYEWQPLAAELHPRFGRHDEGKRQRRQPRNADFCW
jgi:hypothetical protein